MADGIALHGKADRIDRDTDGSLAIVDYKSGGAPSAKAAFDRLDNQLGLPGLIAQRGGMEQIAAAPVTAPAYWSLRPDRRADGAIGSAACRERACQYMSISVVAGL